MEAEALDVHFVGVDDLAPGLVPLVLVRSLFQAENALDIGSVVVFIGLDGKIETDVFEMGGTDMDTTAVHKPAEGEPGRDASGFQQCVNPGTAFFRIRIVIHYEQVLDINGIKRFYGNPADGKLPVYALAQHIYGIVGQGSLDLRRLGRNKQSQQ